MTEQEFVLVCLCMFRFMFMHVCVCMLALSRIYTGGSLVCHSAVLGSLRTWTRIDTRMFCLVSAAYRDLSVCGLLFASALHGPPPSRRIIIPFYPQLCGSSAFLTFICSTALWHAMKFNWLSLWCMDRSVMTLAH